jgi:hypothetical protein
MSCAVFATSATAALSGEIPWRSGSVDLRAQDAAAAVEQLKALVPADGARHVVVQFDRPLTTGERQALKQSGVTLLDAVGGGAYFARVSAAGIDETKFPAAARPRGAAGVELAWKLHPRLAAGDVPRSAIVSPMPDPDEDEAGSNEKTQRLVDDPIVGVYVKFHTGVGLQTVARPMALRHGAAVRDFVESIATLVVEMPLVNVQNLAAEDAVQWIEPALPRMGENNAENRAITEVDDLQAAPYGLDGSGVTVMVYDGGTGRSTHVDFGGRHMNGDTASVSDHATHVAGTIGGDGSASGGTNRGMAPAVDILGYGFEYDGSGIFLYTNPGDIEADYGEAINIFGADISNNSIGTNTEPNGFDCSFQGDYGLTSATIDAIVRGSLGAPYRVVWANGNERQGDRCDIEGFGDYYSTAPPAGAKNHITVGALNANDDSMTSFSSWGPVDDGRLKPDISGPGCQSGGDNGVTSLSSSSDTAYTVKCGTSMSSPTVCGISALLLQDYRIQFPAQPDFRNSTLKTLLAHTAVDNGNVGPDHLFGYGSVRAQAAVDFLRTGYFLEEQVDQGETYSVLAIVGPADGQLKVTLAWDDPPGTPNVSPALVNDLDLVVFDTASNRLYPWTLDPGNPSAAAVQTQEDHVNNIEQVVLDAPPPGVYRIEIHGTAVPTGPQTFSLAASPQLVNCSSQGVVSLDRVKYPCGATATVQVIDCDLNTDDGLVETISITVHSDSEPVGETILLTETAAETAAFAGMLPLATVDAPGTLLIAEGDTVTATYVDADDGQGGVNVAATDSAAVDCTPSMISNVMAIDIGPRDATITFDTDEPALATVHHGAACGALTDSAAAAGFNTSHAVALSGLDDDATYFFAVEVTDQADNVGASDNGGACYTFSTPQVPDFFTENFDGGDNDLSGTSLLFVPNGSVDYYLACATLIAALPTDPAGGTTHSLSDDGSASVALSGGAMVHLYGTSYGSIFVNANGNVTFIAGDGDYTETLAEHFGEPRVAALWDDLNPASSGTVSHRQLGDRIAVTWQNVPEYNTSNQNTFQIELFFNGDIQLSYLSLAASDGIAGLSEGAGLSPDYFETDLSALGSCGPRPPSASGAGLTAAEDTPLTIDLPASDDGTPGPLTYIVTALPSFELKDAGDNHVITVGDLPYALSANGNQVVYTPSGGYNGPDSFQFMVNDGGVPPDGGDSNVATIQIVVLPVLSLPFFDDFPTTTFDSAKWETVETATIDGLSLNPPSPPNAARLNGDPDGGDEIQTQLINLAPYGNVRLVYSYQQTGGGESPDAGDDLYVEYLDSLGAWQVLSQHAGADPSMTDFQTVDLLLPSAALHATFRLRFRNTATAGTFDDWFVDDVSITALDAPTASDGSASTDASTLVDVTLSATDPNLDPLSYVILSLPSDGVLRDPLSGPILAVPHALAAGGDVVRYTPNLGFSGSDGLSFKATDGTYDSNVANVAIDVGSFVPVYVFPMDSNPTGWSRTGQWSFGVPQGLSGDPSAGFTGANVYGYNLGGAYSSNLATVNYLRTGAIDCSLLSGVGLRFRRWLGVEAAPSDHANIQVSNDGSTWTDVWDHAGGTIDEQAWSLQTYDISAVADGQAAVMIRWGLGPTNGSVEYHGWNLDDVEIVVPAPLVCGAGVYGDMDGSAAVNARDVPKFTEVLLNPPAASDQERCTADVHADGVIDMIDLDEFVELLLAQ